MNWQVGDAVPIRHIVRDEDGALTNATVVATAIAPSGTVSNPTMTATSTGVYDGKIPATAAGPWSYYFTVTGAVEDVTPLAQFDVAASLPNTYVSLGTLKSYLGIDPITDIEDDAELQDALESVTREINRTCGRSFWADTAATARRFRPASCEVAFVHDFWDETDLVVETTLDGVTWTAWSAVDYQLEPLDGVVDGEPGWPFTTIRAVGSRLFTVAARATLRLTTKWGWAAIPEPIKESCKIAGSETFALKDARFGVAGWGQMGDIRVRENPMLLAKLKKFRRDPVKVA